MARSYRRLLLYFYKKRPRPPVFAFNKEPRWTKVVLGLYYSFRVA
jgi:hypothetical protein